MASSPNTTVGLVSKHDLDERVTTSHSKAHRQSLAKAANESRTLRTHHAAVQFGGFEASKTTVAHSSLSPEEDLPFGLRLIYEWYQGVQVTKQEHLHELGGTPCGQH